MFHGYCWQRPQPSAPTRHWRGAMWAQQSAGDASPPAIPRLGPDDFRENDTAFKLKVAGVKGPLNVENSSTSTSGGSSGTLNGQSVSGKLNGLAAFLIVPVPDLSDCLPMFTARSVLHDSTRRSPVGHWTSSSRGTEFAWSLGGKFKAGLLSIRAEYERFRRDGRDPAMLSLGFVKYFGRD